MRVHPQWFLLRTRQSGRLCAILDMWTRGPELGLRWILPQAATCPVCKRESSTLVSCQGRAPSPGFQLSGGVSHAFWCPGDVVVWDEGTGGGIMDFTIFTGMGSEGNGITQLTGGC